DPLSHEARLAHVDLKPFLQSNPAHVDLEPPGAALQLLAPGEGQVVRVPRVTAAGLSGQPRQPAIEPVDTQVGQRRRRRGALGQVRSGKQPATLVFAKSLPPAGYGFPDVPWDDIGTQSGQGTCDRGGIAGGSKQGVVARSPDRGEKVAQVQAED